MTVPEITNILLSIVKSQPLSPAQYYEVMGHFSLGIQQLATGQSVLATTTEQPRLATPTPEPAKGPVIIHMGAEFTCTSCKAPVLRARSDVFSTMKISDFRQAFDPPLEPTNSVWSDPQGNAAVDCPKCKAHKTIWILGKVGIYNEIPEGDNSGFQ